MKTRMFVQSQSCDPAVHRLCCTIANRCVWVIQACLREEERIEAAREFYLVCRQVLDKPPTQPEV